MIAAALVCVFIAVSVWPHRKNNSETIPIILLLLGIIEWVVAALIGLLDQNLSHKILWAKFEYIGVVSVPLALLVYVLFHSSQRLNAKRLAWLAIIPVLTLVLAWMNGNHGLIWATYTPYLENGLVLSKKTYGIGFWVYWVYSYLVLLAATILTIRIMLVSARMFRWQSILVVVGILMPWAGNLLYVLHISPFKDLDLTPLAFSITAIMLSIGMFRWQLFDIKPIAQAAMIAGMADGLMILDNQDRVVDVNPAAQAILGLNRQDIVGKHKQQVIVDWLPLEDRPDRALGKTIEIMFPGGREKRDYEFSDSPFYEKSGFLGGRIIFLHDVTDRNRLEESLREAERKQAELILQQAENKYEALFRNMSVGVTYQDTDGKVIDLNPAAERILGTKKTQISDPVSIHANLKTIHPDGSDFPAEENPGVVSLTTGKPLLNQVMGIYFPTQKNYHWINISTAPLFKPGEDRPYRVFVTFEDITERKRAEEALANSEKSYRSLFENASMGIFHSVPEGRFLRVNPALATMLGYASPEELVTQITDISTQLYVDSKKRSEIIKDTEKGDWIYVENPFRRKDGSTLMANLSARRVPNPDGTLAYLEGFVEDITARKQAEEALRDSEQRYRGLFEYAPISLWEEDFSAVKKRLEGLRREGVTDFQIFFHEHPEVVIECVKLVKILDVNKATLRLLRAKEKADLKRNFSLTVQSDALPGFACEMVNIAEGKNEFEFERINYTMDGERLEVSLFWSTAPGYEESLSKVFVSNMDITQRKQADLERTHQAEELARLYRASGSLLSESPFDLHALAAVILKTVLEEFGQHNCSILLVEEGSQNITRVAVGGAYASQANKMELSLDGPGLIPLSLRTGQCINTPDIRENPTYFPGWELARSELTIPLKIGKRVIGAIDVQSAEPASFSANDERLMTIFSERAALALEHARLYSQTERRLENLTALRTIDSAIASSFDINLTLGILLKQVTRQLGIPAADVLIFNPATQTLGLSAVKGYQASRRWQADLPLGESYAGQIVRGKRAITVDDLTKNAEEEPRIAELVREGFIAYIGMPLIAKGLVKGVLEIYQRKPIVLDQEKRSFLDMLAGQAAIAIDSAQLFENLQSSNIELMMAYDATIEGWAQALDLRDRETEGHSRRVTDLTVKLAASFGSTPEELIHIRQGALLHDIGKLGVPDEILRKPGALSDEEWESMRKHPQYAYDLLSPITYLHPALDIPYCHHEKWDGTGYPRGLKENQIPLAARIFAVVDVWDALTSNRPYREAWSKEKALQYIQEQAGKHFDPKVVAVFIREIANQR